MTRAKIHLKQLKKLFGFTHSGVSVVGRKVQKVVTCREIRRLVGVGLMAVLTFVTLVHNFSNIGGNLVLAFNTPKPVIDATTLSSVEAPIDFQYESRGYSWYHPGADLVAPLGTSVRPIMPGTVGTVTYDRFGYGNHIVVKHEQGYESLYGHLSELEVQQGQKVSLDTEIGKSGSTGFSTGPHLHLEVHKDGVPVNPAEIVPGVR